LPLLAAILTALAPPFLLILLGYGLKRARVLHPAHVPILNGLVSNVTLPALIVMGLARSPHLSARSALLPLSLFGTELLIMALVYALGRMLRLPRPLLGGILLVGVFGNTGFIGYPLTLALMPVQFPTAILMDQFGMNLPLYLSAALLGANFGGSNGVTGGGRRAAILRVLRSPLFLAALLGLSLHLITLPPAVAASPAAHSLGFIVSRCLDTLGQGTTPLILLALGVALRPDAVRGQTSPLVLACGCKLLLSPLAVWGICHGLGIGGTARMEGVMEAAMPSAVMAGVLAGQNDMGGDFAVGVVFLSTVLSAVTIPLLLTLLR